MKRIPKGMTRWDASIKRKRNDSSIYACWMCVSLGVDECQWFSKDLKFVGSKALCPSHYLQAMQVTEMD